LDYLQQHLPNPIPQLIQGNKEKRNPKAEKDAACPKTEGVLDGLADRKACPQFKEEQKEKAKYRNAGDAI
jgi:hypothetical protein